MGPGSAGPVHGAAFETLDTTAVFQSADLVTGWVSESPGFPIECRPFGGNGRPRCIGSGRLGPVHSPAFKTLDTTGVFECADLLADGVAQSPGFPVQGCPLCGNGRRGGVRSGRTGPMNGALLKALNAGRCGSTRTAFGWPHQMVTGAGMSAARAHRARLQKITI